MIRETISKNEFGKSEDFKWRGAEGSRLESLTDGVFAFAITLLIVSLQVPKSFDDLVNTMKNFPAFGITLIAIIAIWYAHYLFFRRYGIKDRYIIVLNSALLFVVLFYIYPLKFLATLLINYGILNPVFNLNIPVDITMDPSQGDQLMIIYGFGYLLIALVFALLHIHAYKKRYEIELDEIEKLITVGSITSWGINIFIALCSLLIAIIGGAKFSAFSGWIYALVGPASAINGSIIGKKINKLKKRLVDV
jgi:uncharacterized membrane protein